MELINLKTVSTELAKVDSNPIELMKSQTKKANDFKVLAMTYNMGQNNITRFKDSPDLIFENVEEYDLIVICAQECKRGYKHERLHEIEQYLKTKQFVNIDNNEFVSMWEMWLVCFIK